MYVQEVEYAMSLLTEMITLNNSFQQMSKTQQAVTLKLAATFEDNDAFLLLTPAELETNTQVGSKQQWHDFLQFDPVKAYIKGQMAALATVAQRKAFQSLQKKANEGDVQAARQINELSGIMNSGDNNKVVVMHQISRPKVTTLTTKLEEDSNGTGQADTNLGMPNLPITDEA
jgi:hypothetical protein